ncbi:DNA-binding domain-containing protein [Dyella acidisoli]|uniref:DUF2063 domain-containing protein n=1 Tax=Dyella acidisoli TaxID=1867834 RepID=A0ABQ5XU14_9GAMM|nr:DNA-binding domain-containing protein [Dyella acidisoli]GLQ93981.1 DUF2063 domain-containing protein [Dyella acidisoli]
MSTLQAIQQQMQQAVLTAQTSPLSSVRSDAIADVHSRLAVYQHGYRIRLRDALKNEFVGLSSMVSRGFDALLDTYVETHPSNHFNIRWYGTGLAGFLENKRHDKPQLAEMARLDWAISTAFDATDEPSIDITQLATIPPEAWATLQLVPQGNLQVLSCAYNVDTFRRAADHGTTRPHLRRYAKPRRILVWRHAMSIHYRRLEEDESQVLTAVQRGESFATLCAILAEYHGETAAMSRMVALLQAWVGAGLLRDLGTM